MRVIAGSAKRLQLKTVDGPDTRPTTDRIKETLFNMLQMDIYGCRFLDLFAGSGAIGIEALSRGASRAVFIEHNPQAISCIRDNLSYTKLEHKGEIFSRDVLSGLRRLDEKKEEFDYIFIDPPYNQEIERKVLEYLSTSGIMNHETVVIVEASKETLFDYLPSLGLETERQKVYKTNQHLFIRKGEHTNEKSNLSREL